MPEFVLKKTRDIGDIITDTFTYIRIHFKTYGKALLFYMVPILILSSIILGVSYGGIFESTISAGEDAPIDDLLGFTGGFFLGLLLLMVAVGFMMVITYNHIRLTSKGKTDIQSSDLMVNAASDIAGIIVINIIYSFLVIFASLFFIVPGIYVAIRLCLSTPIYIIEEVSLFDAIRRSWELVNGYWWVTFGILIIMAIITNIISSAFNVPLFIFAGIAGVAGAEMSSAFGTIIGVVYSLVVTVSTLFAAIPMISNSLHYFNLFERKEGSGLRDRIESLGL